MQKFIFGVPFFFLNKDLYDRRRRRYALGIFFIFLVSAIWVASSVCSQFLYTERNFDSPFLVTYIGVCLFAFILPVKWCTDKIGITRDTTCLSGALTKCTSPIDECSVVSDSYENMEDMSDDEQRVSQTKQNRQKSKVELQGEQQEGENNNDYIEVNSDSISGDWIANVKSAFDLNPSGRHWNHSRHMFVAMNIAPVLFVANWLFNASLQITSVASASVLVSTSGMFTLIMAVVVKVETFHVMKLFGVMLGVIGSIITAQHDFRVQDECASNDDAGFITCTGESEHNLWGDTLAVLAAVAFGAYAVQVRLLCPLDEELYSMGLLLGYIGLFIMIPLLPLALFLVTKVDLTWEILLLIACRGFFDYLVSEYLHFRSVVLTNATIATVGLGLTIPMAFFADFIMDKSSTAPISSLVGAVSVSLGFLFVNVSCCETKFERRQAFVSDNCSNPSDEELLESGMTGTKTKQQYGLSPSSSESSNEDNEDFKDKIMQ